METFRMEMNRMAAAIDIWETPFVKDVADITARELLSEVLESKFGSLPPWAVAQVGSYTRAEVKRLLRKVYAAPTLEALFGKKPRR